MLKIIRSPLLQTAWLSFKKAKDLDLKEHAMKSKSIAATNCSTSDIRTRRTDEANDVSYASVYIRTNYRDTSHYHVNSYNAE